jgi:hypothetical protein
MTISRWILLGTRNVLYKSRRGNENTHFMFSNFFRKSRRLWDNVEKYGGTRGASSDVTIWRIRVACWISNATCTHAHANAQSPGKRTHTHMQYLSLFHDNNNSRTRLYVMLHEHCLSCYRFSLIFSKTARRSWNKYWIRFIIFLWHFC